MLLHYFVFLGFISPRGPICYACSQHKSQRACNQIQVCGRDEVILCVLLILKRDSIVLYVGCRFNVSRNNNRLYKTIISHVSIFQTTSDFVGHLSDLIHDSQARHLYHFHLLHTPRSHYETCLCNKLRFLTAVKIVIFR